MTIAILSPCVLNDPDLRGCEACQSNFLRKSRLKQDGIIRINRHWDAELDRLLGRVRRKMPIANTKTRITDWAHIKADIVLLNESNEALVFKQSHSMPNTMRNYTRKDFF